MTRLTSNRLIAMQGALTAMLAGCEGEGDWPERVSYHDMDTALDWVSEQLAKRSNSPATPTP